MYPSLIFSSADILDQTSNSVVCFQQLPRAIFRFTGKDVERYFHGRITQNVKALAVGQSAQSLVLTPQGRVQGQFTIQKQEAGLLLVSDPLPNADARASLLRALLQFKVADEVHLEDLSETTVVVALVGTGIDQICKSLSGSSITAIPYSLGSLPAVLLLGDNETSLTKAIEPHKLPFATESLYELLRLTQGVPRMLQDIDEKVLAPELALEHLVSWNKGCYAGQEVVEMATSRGRANRRLLHFRTEPGAVEVRPGQEVFLEAESPGTESTTKAVGQISSAALHPLEERYYCLAFIKTSVIQDDATYFVGGNQIHLLPPTTLA